MIEFVGLGAKTYASLMVDDSEHNETKETKRCVMKQELIVKDYWDSLLNNIIMLKSQQTFKSHHHNVYIEQIKKILLSSNDIKRFQIFDKVTTYTYGTNTFKVCEKKDAK